MSHTVGKDPWEEEKKRRPGLYKGKCTQEVVAELEPETFNSSLVIPATEDNTVWIVEFYSDRCPFCQSLSPEIIKAAESLDEQYVGAPHTTNPTNPTKPTNPHHQPY